MGTTDLRPLWLFIQNHRGHVSCSGTFLLNLFCSINYCHFVQKSRWVFEGLVPVFTWPRWGLLTPVYPVYRKIDTDGKSEEYRVSYTLSFSTKKESVNTHSVLELSVPWCLGFLVIEVIFCSILVHIIDMRVNIFPFSSPKYMCLYNVFVHIRVVLGLSCITCD